MAKAIYWMSADTETRELGEQTGLDTLLVLALNDVHYVACPLGSVPQLTL